MDKQLIERIALEVCDGIPLEMKTHLPGYSVRFAERFLARIDAERGKDAIGYVEKHMLGMIKEYGFAHAEISTINRSSSRVPLFLSPAIPEGMALVPAPCQHATDTEYYRAECEKLQSKVAEQSAEIERLTQQRKGFMEDCRKYAKWVEEKDATIAQQAERIAELEADAELYGKKDQANYDLRKALTTAIATLERDGDEWGICDQLKAALTPSAANSLERERDAANSLVFKLTNRTAEQAARISYYENAMCLDGIVATPLGDGGQLIVREASPVRVAEVIRKKDALIEQCERFITAVEGEFPVSSKPVLAAIAAHRAKDAP